MKLKPLYPNIVVKPDKEEKLPSGIVLPDLLKKPPKTGEVVAVYEGIEQDVDLKIGDRIQWRELTGLEVDDLVLLDIANALCRLPAKTSST